jgi:hypothetical protein
MSENKGILLRTLDHAFRLLNIVQGSQSTISPPLGDSVNLPDIYFVDSGNGSDTNDGRDPGFPLATIDAAINKCTASQGDIILVQPGHAETLTTQISLDVIGVSIIGVGEGTLRPQLTINAAIDGIDIGAANCAVENIGFAVSTAGALSQINVDAANAKIKEVHFAIGASDILGTITVTANGEICTVEDCTVIVSADGCDEWILVEGVVDLLVIKRNTVACGGTTIGFDEAIIQCNAVAVTNLVVVENTFLGQDASAAIDAVSGSALVGETIGPNVYRGGVVQGSPEWVEGLGYRITKSGARPSGAGSDDLFDINGLVLVTALFGEVTTQIDTNSDLVLNMKAAGGAVLNTITVLDGDVVQTMYTPAAAGTALNVSGTNQAFLTATPMVMNADTLEATWTEAGTTGAILWTLYYIPLETGATVDAAT